MSTTPDAVYSPTRFAAPAEPHAVRTVAIVGAGRVGTALARALVEVGYDVRVVGPGDPDGIRLIVEVVAPGAQAMDASAAMREADLVFIAIPLHRIDSLDPALLRGKIVVDVMNYWAPIDGTLAEFEAARQGTSAVIAQRWKGAHVVKTLNHIGYHDIESDRRKAGATDRRALAVAADHHRAAATVMSVVDTIGFDALYAGDLARGIQLEAGGEVFGVRLDAPTLAQTLSRVEWSPGGDSGTGRPDSRVMRAIST